MKHLKLYEEYTSKPDHPGFFKTREETENWLDQMGVEKYVIHNDLSVSANSIIMLEGKNLKHIPVQFGEVRGFYCYDNQLTSLTGCPVTILGSFDCSENQLTSLQGAPSYIGSSFWCVNNHLTSLTGFNNRHSFKIWNNNNYLTIDEQCSIDDNNPGYKETSLPKIAQNFIDKLETSELDSTTQLRILDSLKENKPQVYSELIKLVDLDDWLSRLQNSEKHKDIIDL